MGNYMWKMIKGSFSGSSFSAQFVVITTIYPTMYE